MNGELVQVQSGGLGLKSSIFRSCNQMMETDLKCTFLNQMITVSNITNLILQLFSYKRSFLKLSLANKRS
jgi:hypothetical protein